MFKFNKVFSPAATQEEVFLDTQPLITLSSGWIQCLHFCIWPNWVRENLHNEWPKYIFKGRLGGATALNERSSRSHSVLTVHVRATGDRLKEAQHINKSLSALGDVISALAQKSTHVPYRNSKLTQVLQSSLGGQAKTLMFVQINPDVESYSETISTLKFAERVSGVELGAARSSKEGKDVRELMEQVASLKEIIARKDEEIGQFQLLKEIGAQSYERHGSNLFRHSSSSPGIQSLVGAIQVGRRLSGGGMGNSANKIVSDPECSDYSDKHSEPGSHQSLDDLKPHNENLEQIKLAEEDASLAFPADYELLGFGDADSEGRLSDISDSVLSMGTETDGSISSVVEFTLFPEPSKQPQIKTEKITKVQSRIPKPLQPKKGQTTSVRQKLNNPLKSPSPSLRKGTTTQASTSAGKGLKRRQ
ncbi:hypothetical protein J5N97_025934 [Dioscorea zingiberensis]|uniref:Kinesin motor domain-containing protein n=1 Tax=Dioscorea zingiberensis TaxID=325984 RepID=A0A9D5C1G8_9LILI|nr:hypothetical protein J5N97_025934 [Dioscorea zingiberensis]